MRWKLLGIGLLCAVGLAGTSVPAQESHRSVDKAEVRVRLKVEGKVKQHPVPAVVWLEPLDETQTLPFLPQGHYTLLQKGRMFTPHLLVVPVGSVVSFPNADPFFHNVFSLFDGKRFDLGLYEAGSSKDVGFSREGVSYIFCNIHPEMSAVVLALSTPLYAVADDAGVFTLRDVPPGNYRMNVWIEGVPQSTLRQLGHRVHLTPGFVDLGELRSTIDPRDANAHPNKFGQPYDRDSKPTY